MVGELDNSESINMNSPYISIKHRINFVNINLTRIRRITGLFQDKREDWKRWRKDGRWEGWKGGRWEGGFVKWDQDLQDKQDYTRIRKG